MGVGRLGIASSAFLALAISSAASSQQFDPEPQPWAVPTIPELAANPSDFVPQGWKSVSIQRGDLNHDGRQDAVVLMRMADPSRITETNDKIYPTDDQNPYLLVVGFRNGETGYRRVAIQHEMLPSFVAPMHGDTALGDDSISIERGAIVVELEHIRGHETFRFRWNGRDFPLIGYDCAGVTGGTIYGLSANYLTGRARVERGPIDDDKLPSWFVRIKPGKRPTLNNNNWADDWIGEDASGQPLSC